MFAKSATGPHLEDVGLLAHPDAAADGRDVAACQQRADRQEVVAHVREAVAVVLLGVVVHQLEAQQRAQVAVCAAVPAGSKAGATGGSESARTKRGSQRQGSLTVCRFCEDDSSAHLRPAMAVMRSTGTISCYKGGIVPSLSSLPFTMPQAT